MASIPIFAQFTLPVAIGQDVTVLAGRIARVGAVVQFQYPQASIWITWGDSFVPAVGNGIQVFAEQPITPDLAAAGQGGAANHFTEALHVFIDPASIRGSDRVTIPAYVLDLGT